MYRLVGKGAEIMNKYHGNSNNKNGFRSFFPVF
jgi:hypothetical protein